MQNGRRFEPDSSDFKQVCIENNCNINSIAEYYGINRDTVYQLFYRQPEYRQLLEECRNASNLYFAQKAQKVFWSNMDLVDEFPAVAQRAAEKVLEKVGHLVGWEDKADNKSDDYKRAMEKLDDYADQVDSLSQRKIADSSINNEQKS